MGEAADGHVSAVPAVFLDRPRSRTRMTALLAHCATSERAPRLPRMLSLDDAQVWLGLCHTGFAASRRSIRG